MTTPMYPVKRRLDLFATKHQPVAASLLDALVRCPMSVVLFTPVPSGLVHRVTIRRP